MSQPIRRRAALAFSLALTLQGAFAAPTGPDLRTASAHFERALSGDEAAIGAAAQAWQEVVSADPGNPLARAYFGAATTMRARTTLLPWRRMSLAEDGLAQIDKALALLTVEHDQPAAGRAAVAVETRFVAARTFLAVPSMFNRELRGQRLLDEARAHPAWAQAPARFQAQVWWAAAQQSLKAGRKSEARQLLQQVVAVDGPQAGDARALLKEL